jgi:adenine-specific DNA-methyltransferase
MVQLPENLDENLELLAGDSITIKNAIKLCNSMGVDRNIAEVAKERIRRAGKLIKQEFNLSEDFDSGFRVLKLDTSNMEETYHNPAKFEKSHITQTIDNIKPNRTSLDLLFQVMLNLGIVLSSFINTKELNGKKYFDVANGKLIACFDNNLSSEVITHLALLKPDFCVFRDYSFASDAVAINAEQIFKTHSPTTNLRII